MDSRTPPDVLTKMSPEEQAAAQRRTRTVGYLLLVATSVGWGLNWPVTKHLLTELPPLSVRGLSGIVGAALLALLALAFRQSLKVPRAQWPRLVLLSVLNVTAWMALMGLALVYLPASEAAVMAYSMPVWASVLAWPILGERISLLRVVAMAMAIAGLVALMGGGGIAASYAKLPGILLALGGAFVCRRHRDGEALAALAAAFDVCCLANPDRLSAGRDPGFADRATALHVADAARLDLVRLLYRGSVLRRLCMLVRSTAAASGIGRGHWYAAGARHRSAGIRRSTRRAVRDRKGRSTRIYDCRRRIGVALVTASAKKNGGAFACTAVFRI